ncbi:nucleotidyltransferase family protein [bacterium]|nr:nucleotidyltransferase family protein [bacterium]MBU1600340.1 nucleotidyltransferase family protein [bacterium]MBU2462232.1 nucleotidyltransferase family protein [bacterium]
MLDYLGIFRAFNEKGIRYIVVGGLAVNLYGIPRMTYDIDIILDLEDKNLENFLNLLREWGFKPKIPVNIMEFANKEKRDSWIQDKNMKAFNLTNPDWAMSEIDVVINTPIDYEKGIRNANYILLDDISMPTISINDLIEMKRGTGRRQDEADIRYLLEIKDAEG